MCAASSNVCVVRVLYWLCEFDVDVVECTSSSCVQRKGGAEQLNARIVGWTCLVVCFVLSVCAYVHKCLTLLALLVGACACVCGGVCSMKMVRM